MNTTHHLGSERSHPASRNLDGMNALDIVSLMNDLDATIASRVREALPQIAKAVDLAVGRLAVGGRLFYVGAGTSGRLGVLDASECPPTFGVSPETIQGVIAGGSKALQLSSEGAEDDAQAAAQDLARRDLSQNDVVLALAASGRTPYCIGALRYAAAKGAGTIALSCNRNALMSAEAQVAIEVDTGAEVLTGSTRLRAGTAQKMVLNMISTAVMVRLGRVYRNYMVDMRPANGKLRERAARMLTDLTGADDETVRHALEEADWHVKTALIMIRAGVDCEKARMALDQAGGFAAKALRLLHAE